MLLKNSIPGSFLVSSSVGRLLFKFLFITVPCTEADAGNTCLLHPSAYISIGQTVHKHTYMCIHPFCSKNKGKVETGKAIGFTGEESNSDLTPAPIREDFLKGKDSSVSVKVGKAFITKGE